MFTNELEAGPQFLSSSITAQDNFPCPDPVTPIDAADQHLQPPALTKQFLISPPASPPIGWEPRDEGEPLVNYDLLAAIANLTPGETHELHAASGSQPGIVVHVCEEGVAKGTKGARISHTRCPDHN
ncbi:regulator of calcineurin 2 [Homalodisca vitripennis]|nr:regulator of calcineurin 2 [Homalodisca vitripennis]